MSNLYFAQFLTETIPVKAEIYQYPMVFCELEMLTVKIINEVEKVKFLYIWSDRKLRLMDSD